MKKISKTLIFFGSGPVAAASLDFLSGYFEYCKVITKTKPLHHKELAPVEELATSRGLPIIYVNNTNELELAVSDIDTTNCCAIVVDFGVIISQAVIGRFQFGIINSHFSLLPEWRGADPITFALLSGQEQTSVCLMLVDPGLDTGKIIARSAVEILPSDDSDSLTQKLISCSNNLFSEHLEPYFLGHIKLSEQPLAPVTYSRKLMKNDGLIDWNKPATVLEREIRAYNIWPKSYCRIGQMDIIVNQAKSSPIKLETGELIITDDGQMIIGCRVGSLEVLELMPMGKRPMPAKAFINGYSKQL